MSFHECVVDVGTQGVQWRTAFLEHLATSHFGTIEAAADLYLNTLGACAHGRCNGHLDGTAVGYLTFNLACDVGCYDLGVHLGAFHLEDIDLHVLVCNFLKLFLEFFYFAATLADDQTGARCAHCNGYELEGAFDDNAGYRAFGQADVEVAAKARVF